MEKRRRLAVLGSTGSIGTQTLDVMERLNAKGWAFDVVALAAGSNTQLLVEQACRYHPQVVSVAEEEEVDRLKAQLPKEIRVMHGEDALIEMAQLPEVDTVVNAVYGSAGLAPTLAALALGKTVALANKESIVIGGGLIDAALADHGGAVLSVDSEHHALHQCLHGHTANEVSRLILTASGGPFLQMPLDRLHAVTPDEALHHPSWTMGRKITVDSATLVNKAFEVIVAHHLYGVDYERIAVVIQPDSYVHSMVEFLDGSIKAELGPRDMRIPIQNLLIHPERVDTGLPRLSFDEPLDIRFLPFDAGRFPAYTSVLQAAKEGGSALAAMNAADEVLIYRFLDGCLPFNGIADGLSTVLARWRVEQRRLDGNLPSLSRLLDVDRWAREAAQAFVG